MARLLSFPVPEYHPRGKGPLGGYPFATGIVAIHGQETFKEGEPLVWWQHITSHEIGHEYWGEWVLDPDDPAWLWIGLGSSSTPNTWWPATSTRRGEPVGWETTSTACAVIMT